MLPQEKSQSADHRDSGQVIRQRRIQFRVLRGFNNQRHQRAIPAVIPQAHAKAQPKPNMVRKDSVIAHREHEDVRLGCAPGRRDPDAGRIQFLKPQRLCLASAI